VPRYLLDTNICIHIRQNRRLEITERFRSLKPGEPAMSLITYGELVYGAEKSQHAETARKGLADLQSLLPVLLLPQDSGQIYGVVRADLAKKGELISSNDLWIAAHALAADLTLITSNEREFRRVPHLRLENWAR
jgi:tRNA(fMet)-specific endonuclease VapC